MVIHRKDMPIETREKMRDGDGSAQLTMLLDGPSQKNARFFAEIILNPGCSIGYHQHDNETEYYFIVSGKALVNDNGTDVEAGPGSSIVTAHGESHSIKNIGDVPLVFIAVIVTY